MASLSKSESRERKINKRRKPKMVVDNKSVFQIQEEQVKRSKRIKRKHNEE